MRPGGRTRREGEVWGMMQWDGEGWGTAAGGSRRKQEGVGGSKGVGGGRRE